MNESIDSSGLQNHSCGAIAGERDVVRVDRITGDNHENAQDQEQSIDTRPPREPVGFRAPIIISLISSPLNLRHDETDKCDNPSELE